MTGVANAVYQEKRFDELPILADALEEAGCSNAAIIDHCRSASPHVRGCWVIDALLGKGLPIDPDIARRALQHFDRFRTPPPID